MPPIEAKWEPDTLERPLAAVPQAEPEPAGHGETGLGEAPSGEWQAPWFEAPATTAPQPPAGPAGAAPLAQILPACGRSRSPRSSASGRAGSRSPPPATSRASSTARRKCRGRRHVAGRAARSGRAAGPTGHAHVGQPVPAGGRVRTGAAGPARRHDATRRADDLDANRLTASEINRAGARTQPRGRRRSRRAARRR